MLLCYLKVRANSLKELVYKQGNAGVTKATVSITFNNADKDQSPVGYEDKDQITVTRQVRIAQLHVAFQSTARVRGRCDRCQPTAGGHRWAQQVSHQWACGPARVRHPVSHPRLAVCRSYDCLIALSRRVQNLFHSVQLNVNNPHFLIMQGRITKVSLIPFLLALDRSPCSSALTTRRVMPLCMMKAQVLNIPVQVLNMKPHEILGMLEEAAGTRMYETKKIAAERTMEKKQVKVDEIDKVLEEDILPALEKLRIDRAEYMSWAAANQDIDRLKRFVIAYEYISYSR